MTTLSTQMPTPAPRPCSPAFATTVATQTIAYRHTMTNRWLGGIRPEALDSGSSVSKRINPGRLPGGLT